MTAHTARRRSLIVLMIACALALSAAWLPRGDGAPRPLDNVPAAVVRLYQPDAASYCFADRRMQGAPLRCVAAAYLTAADMLAFGPLTTTPQRAVPAPVPIVDAVQPTYLSVVSALGAADNDGNATSLTAAFATERSCRPDPVDGRVLCAPADPTDAAAPWVELVPADGAVASRPGGIYAMDAVVIRSAQANGGLCGLVDNAVVCPAANATVFLAVF
ncbi:hypothetical protein pneo_cds_377 [Pandoravirus neocaledonia]|uniref:Uncharacterized protein n=1 Tax=Pandoravirus neocaledonia TaxID=2107708 RepID=A0A2U7UC14_9VIRU|nr:hypothetical protein pneo_cds_377 [Pandoravirus neocaledonia]AVK75984.1 hypothetical protein pneo_cds_377 [Pandoravirus neocaledonia]